MGCFLVGLMSSVVWSAPWPAKFRPIKRIPPQMGAPVKGYYRSLAVQRKILAFEKQLAYKPWLEVHATAIPKSVGKRPPVGVVLKEIPSSKEQGKLPLPNADSHIQAVRLSAPKTTHFESLKEIMEGPQPREIWPVTADNSVADNTKHVVKNYKYELAENRKLQEFIVESPFETRSLDDIYNESHTVFAALPYEDVDETLSIEQQEEFKLHLQEEFYFEQFPYSPILLARAYIHPWNVEDAVKYYVTFLAHERPLPQKLRALTMLGFLGKKGDGVADLILNSLRKDFVNPPWTVDYAAGMALLNLGEVEKFAELVQWRENIEAASKLQTPGISWLYNNVFGEYDFYVQELGGKLLHMRPDSPEEMKIASRHWQAACEQNMSDVEKMMWKLDSLADVVSFLNLKGMAVRTIPASNSTDSIENPQ